jgi:hypothetical protein
MENGTQLAKRSDDRLAEVRMSPKGGVQINTLADLWTMSSAIAASGLAPKGFEKPQTIFVALEMGLELGLPPMAAMQNIAVINGRPSLWGDSQLGLVRASGLLQGYAECECLPDGDAMFREACLTDNADDLRTLRMALAKHRASCQITDDNFGVTVYVCRTGSMPQFGRFTVGDAKRAGLWGKAGPWTQYPVRMLKFRARSFILRDEFGDVLKGLLSAEEAADLPRVIPAGIDHPRISLASKLQLTNNTSSDLVDAEHNPPEAQVHAGAESPAAADDSRLTETNGDEFAAPAPEEAPPPAPSDEIDPAEAERIEVQEALSEHASGHEFLAHTLGQAKNIPLNTARASIEKYWTVTKRLKSADAATPASRMALYEAIREGRYDHKLNAVV